jgi:hypothetical protein
MNWHYITIKKSQGLNSMENNSMTMGRGTGEPIEFDYVNWKGVKGHRTARVILFSYGSTEYHPEKQWLLEAYDLDKEKIRIFAMKDMSNVKRFDANDN